jgi:nitroreductase
MEFTELIQHRQSDRRYTDQPVEKEKIATCLEAARLAPSANNSQPWKFIVVDDPDLKDRVADCSASLGMNKFTFQAPVIIVVVLEQENIFSSIGGRSKTNFLSLRHRNCRKSFLPAGRRTRMGHLHHWLV